MSQHHAKQHPKKMQKNQRPSIYWIGLFLLFAAGIGFFLVQNNKSDFEPTVKGAPRIEVLNDTIDHGDVVVNKMVTSSFEIRNVGDKPLFFRNQPYVEVIEGCCPPKVELSQEVVKSGETAIVKMTYTMHEGMDGPHEFRVHVTSNDPLEPETLLTAYSNWVR